MTDPLPPEYVNGYDDCKETVLYIITFMLGSILVSQRTAYAAKRRALDEQTKALRGLYAYINTQNASVEDRQEQQAMRKRRSTPEPPDDPR